MVARLTVAEAAGVRSFSSYDWHGLPPEIIEDLLGRAVERQLRAGEALFESGCDGAGCYRLDQGLLKVSLASPQGGERIVAILAEGSIVGDLSLIDGSRGLEVAVALRDSRVRFISRSNFQACARRHPVIYQHLLRLFTQRLREAESNMVAQSFLTARGRVAQALLKIAGSLGAGTNANDVTIPGTINQREIAALAGVARESTNRILRTLEHQRLLTRRLRSYRIHDRVKLQREVDS